MPRSLLALTLVITLSMAVRSASADEADGELKSDLVSYFQDIRPIFQANCQGCHQPAKQGGDYVMTSFDRLLKGGESGSEAVLPGAPAKSFLVELISPVDGEAEMPKGKKPLSAVEIELITKWIAEGANDDTPMSARPQYDMDHPPVYNAPPVITSLDYSPDGKLLAVSGYHEVVLHNADGSGSVARLVGMSERIESAVFSPDGKRLAVTGGSPGRMGELQIWDVEKRELTLALTVGYDTLYGASWSGDGKLVAFGCPDTTIRAVDAETGEQVLFNGAHNDWVLDTVFSTKSDHLVTVSRDMSMKLIKVDTQRFIDNITSITPGALKGGLSAVDCHPAEDQLLAGGADGVPKIYKMIRDKDRKIGDDFNRIDTFKAEAMPGRVFDVKFNHDGTQVVAGSSYDGTGQARVYNVADGKTITKVDIPQGGVFAVDFSSDGKSIACGGFDGVVRLFDAATGSLQKEFFPADVQGRAATASTNN